MSDAQRHDIMAVDPDEESDLEGVSLETLRSGLRSDDDKVRTHAARVAAAAARADPTTVGDLVPTLVDRLGDDQNVVQHQCLRAFSMLSREEPERVEPAVPSLVAALDHDLPLLATVASQTLGYVALERPDLFTDHVEALVAATDIEPSGLYDEAELAEADWFDQHKGEYFLRTNAEVENRDVFRRKILAHLLVEVAEYEPAAFVPHVSRFVELLDDEDDGVVAASTDVVASIAREDSDAAAEAFDALCSLLDHGDQGVVVSAVTALGYLGNPDAVGPLRALATGEGGRDFPEEVRELAAETAEFLEDE